MNIPIYLNALRAFEASARHQSFSAAAVELNVTPAAVGQLVRSLEDWLGIPLFNRSTGGKTRLVPTEAALSALPDIRAGFDRLTIGLEKLKTNSSNGVLTVAISPAFAAKWLLPRIDKFQTAYPDMDVRLDTNLKPVDFITNGIDIGVRYGNGSWPGLMSEKFMDEEIFPVCSPMFLEENKLLPQDINNLAELPLIHDLTMDSHSNFTTWDIWLKKNEIPFESTRRSLKINNSAAVLQSAIDGHGIALARSVLAHDDLKAGRLIRLFPEIKTTSALAYYIVFREDCRTRPKLIAFRDWLMGECKN